MDRIEASRILGIGPIADEGTARTAYRQLLHAVHPDRGGDPVMFDLVQEAWTAFQAAPPPPKPPSGPEPTVRATTGERVKGALGELSLGCGATVLFWVGIAVLAFVVAIIRELVL